MTTISTNRSAEAVTIARGELGNAEAPRGANSGPQIQKYFDTAGVGSGQEWCNIGPVSFLQTFRLS